MSGLPFPGHGRLTLLYYLDLELGDLDQPDNVWDRPWPVDVLHPNRSLSWHIQLQNSSSSWVNMNCVRGKTQPLKARWYFLTHKLSVVKAEALLDSKILVSKGGPVQRALLASQSKESANFMFWQTHRGGEWSFKHYGSRKIFVGSRSLVFVTVLCVSQSQFLSQSCLGFTSMLAFNKNTLKTRYRNLKS